MKRTRKRMAETALVLSMDTTKSEDVAGQGFP